MGPGGGEALSRVESALEPLMPQHNDLSRSLLALDQASTLIAVIEMSQSSWLVAAIVPGVGRHPLKKISPDEAALLGYRASARRSWHAASSRRRLAWTCPTSTPRVHASILFIPMLGLPAPLRARPKRNR